MYKGDTVAGTGKTLGRYKGKVAAAAGGGPGPAAWHRAPEMFLIWIAAALLMYGMDLSVDDVFSLPKSIFLGVLLPVMAAVLLVRLVRGRLSLEHPRIILCSAASMIWWVAATATALHRPTAIFGVPGRFQGLIILLAYQVIFLYGVTRPRDAAATRALLRGLVAISLPVALYAVLQRVGVDPIPWIKTQERSAATIGHPVIMAALLGLFIPLALGFLLDSENPSGKALWGGAAALLILGFLSAASRGPLLGLIASLSLFAALVWRGSWQPSRKVLIAIVTAGCVFLMVGAAFFIGREGSHARLLSSKEIQLRLLFWRNALTMIGGHPITGVGPDNYRIAYPGVCAAGEYLLMKDVVPSTPHNGYLHVAVSGGLPALGFHLLLLGGGIFLLGALWRHSPRRERALPLALLAALIGYAVQDLTGWPDVGLTPFFWLLLGIGISLSPAWGAGIPPLVIRYGMGAVLTVTLVASLPLASRVLDRWVAERILWELTNREPEQGGAAAERSRVERMLRAGRRDPRYLSGAGRIVGRRALAEKDQSSYESALELFREARVNQRDYTIATSMMELEGRALAGGLPAGLPVVEEAVAQVLSTTPVDPSVWAAVGRLRITQKRFAEGLEAVRKAREFRGRDRTLMLAEAMALAGLGRFEEAAGMFRETLARLSPDRRSSDLWSNAQLGLALALHDGGRLKESAAVADAVLKVYPNHPRATVFRTLLDDISADRAEPAPR